MKIFAKGNPVGAIRDSPLLKDSIESILSEIDVRLNGDRPWDIQVHNEKLYQRIIAQGSLGLGEAYVDGWWDCPQLDELFTRILRLRSA